MRLYTLLLAMLMSNTLCACTDPNHSAAPDKTLIDSQLQALEKAKGVENTLQQGADHLNESLEKQDVPAQ